MPKVPNAERAIIDSAKLAGYLLSPVHPVGSSKAVWFRARGFDRANAGVLAQQLLRIVREEDVVATSDRPHGKHYVVRGMLIQRGIEVGAIRTVWIVKQPGGDPSFVTAYPAQR